MKTSGCGCGDRAVKDKGVQRWMWMQKQGEDGAMRQQRL